METSVPWIFWLFPVVFAVHNLEEAVYLPHLASTIVLKKYCPGLLTGVALLVPATSYLLFYGYDNEFYSFPKFWFITIPFAVIVIVSIPILFKIGKLLQHGENN